MTNKQINIAIAEACGWNITDYGDESARPFGIPPANENLTAARNWGYVNGVGFYEIKDYCNDLNAMREAEQKMWGINEEFRAEFIYQLAKVINPTDGYRMQEGIDLLDATARQRAEALLKTINQWGGSE